MPEYRYPLEAYVSYSHRDAKLVKQILSHLEPLERENLIKVWSDLNLVPGADWNEEILSRLARARVFLLMVSPNYLASTWCREVDMRQALERQANGEARAVPIILGPCEWMETPLGRLQALPAQGRPVSEWKRRADAFADIEQGVRRVIRIMVEVDEQTAPPDRPRVSAKGGTAMHAKRTEGKTLIIHGHAEKERYELRNFIQNGLGLPLPVVMADAVKPGKTLPQKFEALANEVEFAVALLTPDDKGKAVAEQAYRQRARQNVLVEVGWFWGRLGLDRVLLLVKGEVEIPSDLDGLEFYKFKQSPLELSEKIREFYKAHGLKLR